MNRTLYALGVLLLAATTYANELSDDVDSRFLFNDNATTSLAVSFQSLLFGLFALLALGLLAAVLTFFLFGSGGEETGYADTSYSSYGSYGSGRAAYVYMHDIDNMHAGGGYIDKRVYRQVRRWWWDAHTRIYNAIQTCADIEQARRRCSVALGRNMPTFTSTKRTTPGPKSSSALGPRVPSDALSARSASCG